MAMFNYHSQSSYNVKEILNSCFCLPVPPMTSRSLPSKPVCISSFSHFSSKSLLSKISFPSEVSFPSKSLFSKVNFPSLNASRPKLQHITCAYRWATPISVIKFWPNFPSVSEQKGQSSCLPMCLGKLLAYLIFRETGTKHSFRFTVPIPVDGFTENNCLHQAIHHGFLSMDNQRHRLPLNYKRVEQDEDPLHILAALEEGPLLFLLHDVGIAFRLHRGGGIMPEDQDFRKTRKPINHAVIVLGYGYIGCVLVLICQNSWGLGWGDYGFFFLDLNGSYVRKRGTTYYWKVAGREAKMGLSTPKTEKYLEDSENGRISYGCSAMPGWPTTIEAALAAFPDKDSSTSVFGVSDGRAGKQFALFCAKHLRQQMVKNDAYTPGDLVTNIWNAYFSMDETMQGQSGWRDLAMLQGKFDKISDVVEGSAKNIDYGPVEEGFHVKPRTSGLRTRTIEDGNAWAHLYP